MSAVTAIETSYRGYRFRSRTEARWAIFLDELLLKCDYEKQGYNTPAGPYLPDFWMIDLGCFIEIKPTPPTEIEIARAVWIRNEVAPIAIFFGSPGDNPGFMYCHDKSDSSCGPSDHFCVFGETYPERKIVLVSGDNFPREYVTSEYKPFGMVQPWPGKVSTRNARIQTAKDAAKSARFDASDMRWRRAK